jgi:hypothetical protein
MTTTLDPQGSLFGYAPGGTIAPPAGGARHTDPTTSHETASDYTLRVKWRSERHLLLSAFEVAAAHDDGGINDDDAADLVYSREAVYIDSVESVRRCSELRKAGLIEITGVKRPKRSGRNGQCSRITRAGTEELARVRQHRRGDGAKS